MFRTSFNVTLRNFSREGQTGYCGPPDCPVSQTVGAVSQLLGVLTVVLFSVTLGSDMKGLRPFQEPFGYSGDGVGSGGRPG